MNARWPLLDLPAARLRRRGWLGLLAAAGAARATDRTEVAPIEAVYPRMPERPLDAYPYRLLQAALEASGRPFSLRLGADVLPSMRAFKNLQVGEFNVMDAGAAPRLAEEARVLPFPLDLGLSGYRLLLVRRDQVARLQAMKSLQELQAVRFGQGPDWVDARILRHAGLKVEEAQFLSLFRMLEAGRFDAFPLGVDEAARLLAQYRQLAPSVVVFDGWCLHYRFARVFVVASGHVALYEALQDGLTRLFADGRAQALLAHDAQLGPVLSGRVALPRRVFELTNPEWSAAYQAIPEGLFFKPRG